MAPSVNPTTKGNAALIQKIISEITRLGPITFARFMELALYDNEHGYYMTKRSDAHVEPGEGGERIGWSGDFYTAPDVHPMIAKALVNQVREVDRILNSPSTLTVIEMGGGKGLLARDFLRECEKVAPDLVSRLTYLFVECSPAMRASQETQVREFLDKGLSIRWILSLSELQPGSVTGVVFSNEFVDALPVHRVTMHENSLQEVFVDREDEGFAERLGAPSTDDLQASLDSLQIQLAKGYTTEVHLEAQRWIDEVARVLAHGIVVTIDYGHTAQDYYRTSRTNGTLLCYYRHTVVQDPYIHVGEQDMTAHVNFSGLAVRGEQVGLSLTGYTNLMSFLLGLGAEAMLEGLDQESEELQSAIQLLRPNGMGSTFKVLIQHTGMEKPSLQALQFRPFFDDVLVGAGSPIN